MKNWRVIWQLLSYLWADNWSLRLRAIFAVIATLVMVGIEVAVPLVLKVVVDALTTHTVITVVLVWLFAYGILWTISYIITPIKYIITSLVTERGVTKLLYKLFQHLLSLSPRFHLQRKTGEILTIIDRAQYAMQKLVYGITEQLPLMLEIIIAVIIVYKLYGLYYGITIFATAFSYFLFIYLTMDRIAVVETNYNSKQNQLSNYLFDSLSNYETIRYFNNDRYEHRCCQQRLQEREDSGVTVDMSTSIIDIVQMLIVGTGLTLIMWQAIQGIYAAKITIGDFVLLNSYLLQFAIPMSYFGYVMRDMRKAITDLEQVLELLGLEPEIKDLPQAKPIQLANTSVTFVDVNFNYGKHRNILRNVSFTVPPGKTLAIVGPTGVGKSTITKLLLRFFDPDSGRILIGGEDIKSVTQTSLLATVGVVPQETVLFNRTIYDNIAYGNPNATRDEIMEAAKLAELDKFIAKLRDGYDTLVGERGVRLSGGEKQRIAIARVILKKPAIYVFDEATASLDINTERQIQRNLAAISVGNTTIIIAHRIATVVNAHEILVLSRGDVVERGTHEELLQKGGMYEELWRKFARVEM